MTMIVVSALLSRDGQALLARRPDGAWELPAEPLGELESTEEALARVLHQTLGVDIEVEEFVDTYYERGAGDGQAIVRNVFRVDSWRGTPHLDARAGYSELRWIGLRDLGEIVTTETQRTILRDSLASGLPATPSSVSLDRGAGEAPPPGAPITVITGPAGAGKSTIAGLLCTRLERAAHIEVDLLRDMVISGYASPVPGLSDPGAAGEQLSLAAANAVALARNFSLAGYEAVIDDVIETPDGLDELLQGLSGAAEVYFITLLADEETLCLRDAERDPDLRMGQRCLELLAIYQRNGEQRGLRLDNSRMSKSETVSWILANRDAARVL